jgi:hypothetical protein
MPIDQAVLAQARALVANAGMGSFVRAGTAPASEGAECVVEIALIDPPVRDAAVPNFDKTDPDRPGIVRSASILSAIRDGLPLPPVTLFQRAGETRYELRDGFHRFHLCAALGYTHVAAVVTDWKPGNTEVRAVWHRSKAPHTPGPSWPPTRGPISRWTCGTAVPYR